jgi:uroporphyrin-3 C-methyltransferase
MTNKNETDPQLEDLSTTGTSSSTTSSRAQDDAPPRQTKKSGNGILWFVVIILFLLIGAVAGAGYWVYEQQQSVQQASSTTLTANNQQLQKLSADKQQLTSIVAAVENQNTTLNERVSKLASENAILTQRLDATLEQMNNMEGRRPSDWLIAEADYLVRMAGRKLWLENDVRTAILLLVNADKRLKSLADPSVLPVRAALAEDIQSLQQLNPVSPSSVALALTGMVAQIDKLPLNKFEKPVDVDANDNALSESTDDWQENLAKVWQNLKDSFLTVKTIEGPVEPVLSLEAQFLLKEQLRLQLMHAQSAALKGDEGLYNQSLQYAQTILIEKFDINKSQVSGFVSAIQNLMDTDVARPIPTELVAQKPLSMLLDNRVKQVFGQGASAL